MPPSRLLPHVVLFLVTVSVSVRAESAATLSSDDQLCFYTSVPARSCTPLRSCRTCLNADLATPTCFLDSRGLCLAMSSYDAMRSDGVSQFVAANTTYCPASDATCNACLATAPESGVCMGSDGACVCLSACEVATWQDDVKALVHVSAAAANAPSVVNAPVAEASSNSAHGVVIAAIIAAVVVLVVMMVMAVRRRANKKRAPDMYNIALTPTMELPPKVRV